MGARPEPIYVRVSDAPAVFAVSVPTIYRAKARGELTVYKRGRSSLLRRSEVEAWIEGREGGGTNDG